MNLDVLIPSLAPPALFPEKSSPPRLPGLERLLARADRSVQTTTRGTSWIFERWGVAKPYPVAPFHAQQDGLDATQHGWICAAPVHLVPDRDRLRMLPSGALDLDQDESKHLIAALDTHFSDRGLAFFGPGPLRWYVRAPVAELPETTPLALACRDNLAENQPKSTGNLNWRALQNEAQMLLFNHPANEAREAVGKLTVNGVWFWGGGVLPELKRPEYDIVMTHADITRQLAINCDINTFSLSLPLLESAKGNVLLELFHDVDIVNDRENESMTWTERLASLDETWFRPILKMLQRGKIRRLRLISSESERVLTFEITPRMLRARFWRFNKPVIVHA